MITIPGGGEKRIENIIAGDRVQEALTGREMEVVNCLNSPGVGMVRITVEGDIILDVTGDQNVLTDAGMIAANRITAGTGVRVADGFAKCTGVEPLMGDYMVYDVQVMSELNEMSWAIANGLMVCIRD